MFIAECGGAQYARDKGIPIIPFPKLKDGSGLSSNDLVIALRWSPFFIFIFLIYIRQSCETRI